MKFLVLCKYEFFHGAFITEVGEGVSRDAYEDSKGGRPGWRPPCAWSSWDAACLYPTAHGARGEPCQATWALPRSVAIDHSLFTKSEKQEGEVTTALPPAMCNRESRFSRGYKGYGKNEFSKCAHGTRAIQDCALTFDACMEQDRTRLRPKKGKMVREE